MKNRDSWLERFLNYEPAGFPLVLWILGALLWLLFGPFHGPPTELP